MKVVIATGGTGGHIYPAMLVARELARRSHEVLFLGGRNGVEGELAREFRVPFSAVRGRGFPKRLGARFAAALWELFLGIGDAIHELRRFRPTLVVGGGGYSSAPVVAAARILGIPFILLEQNLLPGRVTRLFARYARNVLASFPESIPHLPGGRVVVTGTPVRPEILATTREEGRERLGLDRDRFTILVVGASQGAQSFNRTMVEIVRGEGGDPGWQWVHVTGKAHYEGVLAAIQNSLPDERGVRYRGFPYLENIADAYAAADLVVARAGATTLAELIARGVPAILVPYPHAAEQHQLYNARWLAQRGGGVLLLEEELSAERLVREIRELQGDPGRLAGMRAAGLGQPGALEQVLAEVLNAG